MTDAPAAIRVTELDPAYHGEALLLRWGESSTNGRTITLQLEEEGPHPLKGFSCGKNGQRFAVVLVPVSDSEEPRTKTDVDPMVREAGMLAKDPRFRKWVAECVGDGQMCGEADAAEFIREFCGIESRRELSTNPEAREKWVKLRGDFYAEGMA